MGGQQAKQGPAPIDMNDALINMKMKSKQFERESNKCEKEEKKCIVKAKESLKKGNEEGAKLFLELAAQKKTEGHNYLRMSARLEHLAGQIKSKSKSLEMVDELARFTPLLNYQAEQMPVEQMYQKMQDFSTAYDNMTVKGKMIDETTEQVLGEKGSTTKVDQMMKELKAEISLEIGGVMPVQEKNQQANTISEKKDTFFDDLKNH